MGLKFVSLECTLLLAHVFGMCVYMCMCMYLGAPDLDVIQGGLSFLFIRKVKWCITFHCMSISVVRNENRHQMLTPCSHLVLHLCNLQEL